MNGVHILNGIHGKKIFVSLYVFITATLCCLLNGQSEEIQAIAHAYVNKDYEHVRSVLENFEPKNSIVWYLLAQSYAQEQNYPRALAAIRAARLGAALSNFNAILDSTKQIKRQLSQPFSSIKEAILLFIYALHQRILAMVFVLSWWLFFMSLLVSCLPRWCRIYRLVLIGILLITGSLLVAYYAITEITRAVVVEQVPLYVLPELNSPHRGVIVPGEEIELEKDTVPSWFRVNKNGMYGWIPAHSITRIEKDLTLSKVRT